MTAYRGRLTAASAAAAVVSLAALIGLAVVPSGRATVLPLRTLRVSVAPDGAVANGASQNPVLSTTGAVIVFDTTATNLVADDANGAVRDVVAIDNLTGERRLVSAPAGAGANGPSSAPAISRDGQRIVFVSAASNLVAGDTNNVADLFVRDGRGPISLVSAAADGEPADAASQEPDVSADGRYVVFTSAATNLVAGDTDGQADVFVRDLTSGRTTLVSVSSAGVQGNGPSQAPAISADGRIVSFWSKASNLVPSDTNGVGDVFVRDLLADRTARVSVSTKGRQQNRAVIAPFNQISDVTGNGRYVVFDSDATNLTAHDTNRHTDVFRYDRRRHRTTLVSVNSLGFQGNNDSFAPTITANGGLISFESFATNMAAGDGPREDIFLRDLRHGTTSVVNVPATGGRRAPELVSQLLQRPSISSNGTIAAFSSTSPNLTAGDSNGQQDVFFRLLAAPRGESRRPPRPGSRPVVFLGADDPFADSFVCRIDDRAPFTCALGRVQLPRGLREGRHLLSARAGGPGMLYDPLPLQLRVTVDRHGPRTRISLPRGRHSVRRISGIARDALSHVASVHVGVGYFNGKQCRFLSKGKFTKRKCRARPVPFTGAQGGRTWHLSLPRSIHGLVAVFAYAVDDAGNRGKTVRALRVFR